MIFNSLKMEKKNIFDSFEFSCNQSNFSLPSVNKNYYTMHVRIALCVDKGKIKN